MEMTHGHVPDARVRSSKSIGRQLGVSTQDTDSSSNGEDNNKENLCPGSDTENDNPLCTANLHLLWCLADGATKYWQRNAEWLRGLEGFGLDVFMVNTTKY
jgi:hypothetical protein